MKLGFTYEVIWLNRGRAALLLLSSLSSLKKQDKTLQHLARLCGQFKDVDSTTLLVLPQEPTCPGSEEVKWCRQDTKAQCQHGCAHLYVRVWVMILLSCDRTNGRKVILVFVGAHYILIPAKGFSNNGDIENILQGGKGIKFPGIPSCSTTDKLKRLNTNFFI